jgi:very-short-patch-repair endonuclease
MKLYNNTLNKYDSIAIDIVAGLNTQQLSTKYNLSKPTILKLVRYKGDEAVITKLSDSNHQERINSLRRRKGKSKSTKGKTYVQIYGIDKAQQLREARSSWLKSNNIRKYAKRISKPQAILFSIVKTVFPQAQIEYEVKVLDKKSIWLDIAIPDRKINIEYDGIYWHEKNNASISLKDDDRDTFLHSCGWTVFRIRSTKNLTENELQIEFNSILSTI